MNALPRAIGGLLTGLALVCWPAGIATAAGRTLEYALPLPANQLVSYRIELVVEHPGRMTIEADWSGGRVLALRLVRPGAYTAVRRSGPAPLHFAVDVPSDHAGSGEPWTLWIRGLPARDAGSGNLAIALPQPPEPAPPEQEPLAASRPESDSWRRPLPSPVGLSGPWVAVYDSTERFRRLVVDGTDRDHFGWHDGFLRFLEGHRASSATGASRLTGPTVKMFQRLAQAAARVERMRTTDDPVLRGPPPADPARRRAWIRVREARLLPLADELDTLLHDLQDGFAPQVRQEVWATRLVSCLIACQRHFDEAGRSGDPFPDDGERFAEQWESVLAAARVLEDLAALP